jgi:membrane protein DedA with SNARE-associated domain
VKSVFIGRFFGPLRAVIPLVAGITRMPTGKFQVANVASALIWAPALLIPGAIAERAISQVDFHGPWKAIVAVIAMVVLAVGIWFAKRLGYFGKS